MMALDYAILTNHRPRPQPLSPSSTGHQLLSAIKHEQLSSVVKLLETGVDVNVKGDNYWTPLTLACRLGRKDVVEYLLHWNIEDSPSQSKSSANPTPCDINQSNDYGDTPLICAAREGHDFVVTLLLESGVDANLANQYSSMSPLLVAIDSGHVKIVTVLLAYDADVQLTDNVKMTPLYTAIKLKDCEKRDSITRLLIDAECDVNIGSQDHSPIFLASRMGYLSVVKGEDRIGNRSIMDSLPSELLPTRYMLCEANCDINVSNKYGVTPVYEAAIKGHNSVVEYLLSQGCEMNKQDMYSVSPLHAAAVFNNSVAVKMLLEAGASVKQRNQSGRCAVHAAMEQGFSDVVEVFLCHGVDITQPPTSIKGLPSLNKVFEHGHAGVVRVLITGCSKLPINQCPAACNMFRSNPDLVELLILSGMRGIPDVFASPDHPSQHSLDPELAKWLNNHHKSPLSLQNSCRIHIRRCLENKVLHAAELLPLPKKLKDFVIFRSQ